MAYHLWWVPVASTFENLSRINPHITAKSFRPPLIIMTREQFNSEHYIPSLISSFSVSADCKITTSSVSRKVKYDKTNPNVRIGPWSIRTERQGAVAHFDRHPEPVEGCRRSNKMERTQKKEVKLVLNLFQYMTKRTQMYA